MRRNRTSYLFTGLVFFLELCTISGQKILYPEIKPADVRFDNFPLNNGAGEQATWSIIQDRKGFIWSGTEFGLYRFDGIRYQRYALGRNDSTLMGYTVNCIFEDSGDTIWAGTIGALNRLNLSSGTISHFIPDTTDLASDNNTIRAINEDSTGLLWLLTDRDVFTLNIDSEIFTRYIQDSSDINVSNRGIPFRSYRFLEDSSGKIWIGTDKGLFLFTHSDNKWQKVFPSEKIAGKVISPKINCVEEDAAGNIWFGTRTEGLYKIPGMRSGQVDIPIQKITSIKHPAVTALMIKSGERIWVFGNSVLSDYNPETGNIKSYFFSDIGSPFSYGENLAVNKIFEGAGGKLWLIDIVDAITFKFDPATENLKLYRIPRYINYTCIRDNTNNFWYGAVGQNMFRMVTDTIPYMTVNIPNADFSDEADKDNISQDTNGDLWLALLSGIYKMRDPAVTATLIPEKIDLPSENAIPYSVLADKSGNIWFGFDQGIIFRYNPENKAFKKMNLHSVRREQGAGEVAFIKEDDNGTVRFASRIKGLFKISQDDGQIGESLDLTELSGSRPDDLILDFMEDSNGNYWISTLNGLFRTDSEGNKIKEYTGFDGTGLTYGSFYVRIVEDNNKNIWVLNLLNGPYIYDSYKDTFVKPDIPEINSELTFADLLFDRQGRMWLGTYGRIRIFDPVTKVFRDFIFPENIPEKHSYLLKSGEVIFTIKDKMYIFPEEIPVNRFIPHVFITNLYVNDKEYNKLFPGEVYVTDLKKVDLNYRHNSLKFEFAALNYTQPHLNKYRYFMTEADKDTVMTGPGLTAEYKNLAPGRYKFWVTGSNNDGLWNPAGVSLDIHIHPPWYRSALAWILYLVAITLFISAYIRLRLYRLKKEKIKLEAEVKARTEELEIKNLQLAETYRIKTHFFTDISHEIRTPLSLITGPLETIAKDETISRRMAGMINVMKRNAQRLLQLVNQLLDISRLDAGKMKINLKEDDIVKSLRIIVYEFLSAAESKHIKYIAELPEKVIVTWFDKDKIEKIISNLLSNAFKYTPENGTVRCTVEIKPGEKDCNRQILNLKVMDTGPGIEKENLDKIFQRFFRVEGRIETTGYGTGIGLSLVSEFTGLLHGEIKVNSTPGKGSEFIISLPLGKDHLSSDEYVIMRDEKKETPGSKIISYPVSNIKDQNVRLNEGIMRVLVIEDNDDLRNFIKDNLTDGYHVLLAENGRTGINIAFTMMPDIIVTDIMMPDIDGITLCRQLKNDERTSHIPVIMLTAKATMDDKLDGLRSGADDYIIKPFIMVELSVRIENLLQLRKKLRAKYLNLKVSDNSDEKSGSVDERFMGKVLQIISDNISNFDFDVGILHEQLGMSRMHLFRKIRILTGLTPHSLIRNLRLEKAADLISRNAGNITEIAYSVGFSNASGFTKAFRDHFGVSPRKYSENRLYKPGFGRNENRNYP